MLHTINYKKENFEEKIKDVTGKKGVDVLIDFVGASHWNKNLGSLALDGRMVILGLLSGSLPVTLHPNKLTILCRSRGRKDFYWTYIIQASPNHRDDASLSQQRVPDRPYTALRQGGAA
jgi:NADPH:quinone reductase-like Zn-dependent oxidoreductase